MEIGRQKMQLRKISLSLNATTMVIKDARLSLRPAQKAHSIMIKLVHVLHTSNAEKCVHLDKLLTQEKYALASLNLRKRH